MGASNQQYGTKKDRRQVYDPADWIFDDMACWIISHRRFTSRFYGADQGTDKRAEAHTRQDAADAVPKSKKLLQFTLDDGSGEDRTILSGIHAYYEPEELIGKTCIAITNLPPRKMMGIDSCGMLISAVHQEEGEERLHLLMVDDHIPAGAKLY